MYVLRRNVSELDYGQLADIGLITYGVLSVCIKNIKIDDK